MSMEDASTLLDLLEAALAGNWPGVKADILGRGYTPEEVARCVVPLCDALGRDTPFTEEDFE